MRKIFMLIPFSMIAIGAMAQDSLKTTTLKEVVVTGTKFDLPVEKSGKTIFKLDRDDLEKNAGKSLADLLNEVPGIQTDGNFSTPGTNVSYYVRGARSKQTLILIDGVPLNDPSSITAEYDLRYIPVSQIESIEVLKGGLSTLYGTSAAAGVINIKLKEPTTEKISGDVDISGASYNTFSQNGNISGKVQRLSFQLTGNNTSSTGFSSAQDNDPSVVFDKDGFSRQNGLLKLKYKVSDHFSLAGQSAYEKFKADYDAYEFTDAANSQTYSQLRLGLNPNFSYGKGNIEGKLFYNANERNFKSTFGSTSKGKNTQAEVIHRHTFSGKVQTLAGINYQHLEYDGSFSYDESQNVSSDSAKFTMIDPYGSFFIDLPSGLNVHAGARLNTHSVYGSQLVYNLNPSFTLNKDGNVRYKILGSVSTSYLTPSLYQLYSIYGNKDLKPENSLNYEGGVSLSSSDISINAVWYERNETDPIDFVSIFDVNGIYLRSEYQNLTAERKVYGIEFNTDYKINNKISFAGNFTVTDTDKPKAFYKIPKYKYGANINVQPVPNLTVSFKYNHTGQRTTFDFSKSSEVQLRKYNLVDLYGSYSLLKNSFTLYGAINNLFDQQFIALYGYTTRGRNFSLGVRYKF